MPVSQERSVQVFHNMQQFIEGVSSCGHQLSFVFSSVAVSTTPWGGDECHLYLWGGRGCGWGDVSVSLEWGVELSSSVVCSIPWCHIMSR